MIRAIPLALDLFVAFDQGDDGHNLSLDLRVGFEDGEFYLDDAHVIDPSTGIYSQRRFLAPAWLWRTIECDDRVRAAAERAWHEHEVRNADEEADLRRDARDVGEPA